MISGLQEIIMYLLLNWGSVELPIKLCLMFIPLFVNNLNFETTSKNEFKKDLFLKRRHSLITVCD